MEFMMDSLMRHMGQTVTVFTASGGLSGNGFTGVLAGIHKGCIRLITDIGAPPACPVGSSCCGNFGVGTEAGFERPTRGCGQRGWGWNQGWRGSACGCGWGRNRWGWSGFNWLGSVAEIPCDKIVSFTHNSIG